MNSDVSLPPNAPMTTNGTLTPSAGVHGHGEADASNVSATPHPTLSLEEVCADIHARVAAFLAVEGGDEVLRRTQEQTRSGLDVIEKALEDYEFQHLSLSYNGGKDCLVLLLLYLSVLHTHFSKRRPNRRKKQHDGDASHNTRDDTGESDINHFPTTIPSIYAKPPDPFPQVTSFVASSSARYHLDLVHISTSPSSKPYPKSQSSPPQTSDIQPSSSPPTQTVIINDAENHNSISSSATTNNPNSELTPQGNQVISFRDAFALYLSHHHPSCRAIFVGTRRTDPHGHLLSSFQLTDGLWPRFMRVHPVLDFTLGQIWVFLRHPCIRLGVEVGVNGYDHGQKDGRNGEGGCNREIIDYCELYDQGYTSLGGVNDTHRNPKLRDPTYQKNEVENGGGGGGYRPAWSMLDDDAERAGRE